MTSNLLVISFGTYATCTAQYCAMFLKKNMMQNMTTVEKSTWLADSGVLNLIGLLNFKLVMNPSFVEASISFQKYLFFYQKGEVPSSNTLYGTLCPLNHYLKTPIPYSNLCCNFRNFVIYIFFQNITESYANSHLYCYSENLYSNY